MKLVLRICKFSELLVELRFGVLILLPRSGSVGSIVVDVMIGKLHVDAAEQVVLGDVVVVDNGAGRPHSRFEVTQFWQ